MKSLYAKGIIITITAIGVGLALPLSAYAASQFSQNTVVNLEADQTIDGNFYTSGETIGVRGTVQGNAYVAGRSVTISGKIAKDATIAAASVIIDGAQIGADLRIFAGEVTITNTQIGDELIVGSGSVTIDPATVVNGTAMIGGGNTHIRPTINGDLLLAGGTADTEAKVKGMTYLSGGKIVVGSASELNSVTYYSDTPAEISDKAKISGEVTQHQTPNVKRPVFTNRVRNQGFFAIWSFISALLLGLIISRFLPKLVQETVTFINNQPWRALGWGLIAMIVTPIIAGLLIITLFGLPIGIILLGLFTTVLYCAKIFMGILLGQFLMNRPLYDTNGRLQPLVLIVGIALFILLTVLPYVGPLFSIFSGLLVLGAMYNVLRARIAQTHA